MKNLILILCLFLVCGCGQKAYKIPTETMAPTLLPGDRILVDRLAYVSEGPKRGDIIVFRYPEDPHRDFVKRVIGLPGETVEINSGQVLINGTALTEEPYARFHYENRGDYGSMGKPVKVPENSYYVMGDNSAKSRDSRYWGFVSRGALIGRATEIYFPFDRRRPLSRNSAADT